jgi:KUP system potassium uptake protein
MSETGHGQKRRFEGAHKGDLDAQAESDKDIRSSKRPTGKRSLNMSAHKLGYLPPGEEDGGDQSEELRARFQELESANRDVVAHAGKTVLVLGALGVVYGDLGTSPLYTEQAIFSNYHATAHVTPANVYGIASLIFWALTIIVSIKYAGFIMRAHNRGDGGIMALTSLLQRNKVPHMLVLTTLGLIGAGLFLGDGMVTPSISVLSAVAGVQVATPALTHLIVPISVAILIGLFVLQASGSATIGFLFGPVMLVWFAVIGLIGLSWVVKDPGVFQGLSPSWAVRFMANHGAYGYLTLGGVVLAVTGAEALYADRGHFGANPIRIGWFAIALPALVLNYLGQAVWVLHHPTVTHSSSFNPFFQVAPRWALWPLVILATFATTIASQAAISGSFSVARQAVQLGFLPRLKVRHTSDTEGQVYVPVINWILCIGVLTLTLVFRSANKLGDIYGVAVTGTFVLNTVLFVAVARLLWKTPRRRIFPLAAVFLIVEVAFFSANVAKVEHGAWLPLAVAAVVALVMINWRHGQVIVTRNRIREEGPLNEFLEGLPEIKPPIVRVPGVAVFLSPTKNTTPLALRAEVQHNHTLHDRVVIVSVDTISVPHTDRAYNLTVERMGTGKYKVFHVTTRVGYHDKLDVPEMLRMCRKQGLLERNLDLEHASYFLSRIAITPSEESHGMAAWRKKLFMLMARNAASPIDHFGLPANRTVIMGSQVEL